MTVQFDVDASLTESLTTRTPRLVPSTVYGTRVPGTHEYEARERVFDSMLILRPDSSPTLGARMREHGCGGHATGQVTVYILGT